MLTDHAWGGQRRSLKEARILGYLKRQRVITVDPDADVLSVSDELAERDPALAQLYHEVAVWRSLTTGGIA